MILWDRALPFIYWFSIAGLAYIYVGYPLLVWLLSRVARASRPHGQTRDRISVIVTAHNEAHQIQRKLDSILVSTVAHRIDKVIVASDGSTDDTCRIVQEYPDQRVQLLHWTERAGKPTALNNAIPLCTSEIVVLTDARQELHPEAIGALAANFADPELGVVSGELVLKSDGELTAAAQGIGFYWKYEKFIRKCESRFRGVPGATGAIYALRNRLFRPIDPATLLDDVVIPMQIVEQGFDCRFEPGAIAYDLPSQSPGQESIRKRRTIAGAAQLIVQQPRWLFPSMNPLWLEFFSHKICRLFSPLLLVAALVTNVLLKETHPVYGILLPLQGLFYEAAILGWLFQQSGRRSRWLGPFLMFLTLNLTTVAAMWDALRGKYRVTWRKAT